MKITGYRCLRTFHDWGRPVGDVNGFIDPGISEVAIVVLETDEGIEGVGMGSHQDIDRLFPALEGEDPRAVTALYDRMLARVFKAGHSGATFGGIGTLDMAIWDLKAKLAGEPLWRLLGARDRFVSHTRWITVLRGREIRLITIEDVLCFEADSKYVAVVTAEGESLISTPLKELMRGLDPQVFWQIHRSTVVNVNAIDSVHRLANGRLEVRLKGVGRRLLVSDPYMHLFRQM